MTSLSKKLHYLCMQNVYYDNIINNVGRKYRINVVCFQQNVTSQYLYNEIKTYSYAFVKCLCGTYEVYNKEYTEGSTF